MPHFDGPAYHNRVFVMSVGGPAILHFYKDYGNQPQTGIILENNSLLVFEDNAYSLFLHGISFIMIDTIFLKI